MGEGSQGARGREGVFSTLTVVCKAETYATLEKCPLFSTACFKYVHLFSSIGLRRTVSETKSE